jgi:hypothetical protein
MSRTLAIENSSNRECNDNRLGRPIDEHMNMYLRPVMKLDDFSLDV